MTYSIHTHINTHTLKIDLDWSKYLLQIQEALASDLETDIGYNKTFVVCQIFCRWNGTLQYTMSIYIQIFSNSPFTKPRDVSMLPDCWKNTITWLNNSAVHIREISGFLRGLLRPLLFLGRYSMATS
jgi:hypothetical protein